MYGDGEESIDLQYVALLIDKLHNDDLQARLHSMNKLPLIAKALGPERTRDELLPFLSGAVDDDDEILLVIAEGLGKFDDLIGGPEYIPCLLPPLEALVTVEEPSVRVRAIESLRNLCSKVSSASVEDHFVPLVRNLSTRDWFTCRVSACFLVPEIYHRLVASSKAEFRGIFGQLCRDDTPMVRRAAVCNLGSVAEVVEIEYLISEILPLFKMLTREEQDSVRQLSINNAAVFAARVDENEIVPIVLGLMHDNSWRVRWNVANSLSNICEKLHKNTVKDTIAPNFVKLLEDLEPEVRTSAAGRVVEIARFLDSDSILKILFPSIGKLADDSSIHVRFALAAVIMDIAPLIGRSATIDHFLPIFLMLLKDENAEVRLNVISNLEALNSVVGIDILSQSLLPAIVRLAEDNKWRTRLAIIEQIPFLAQQLRSGFSEGPPSLLCMEWLSDKVSSVREAAASNLKRLAEIFGESWARTVIIPRIEELNSNSNYLCRITGLRAIEALASLDDSESLSDEFVPLVLQMVNDPVPNVRLNVAKCIKTSLPAFRMDHVDSVLSSLRKLMSDEDVDVRYYATLALDAFNDAQ